MQLTDEALREFEDLYKRQNPNKEVSKEELIDMATRTMRAVKLVYRPIPRKKLEGSNQKNEIR